MSRSSWVLGIVENPALITDCAAPGLSIKYIVFSDTSVGVICRSVVFSTSFEVSILLKYFKMELSDSDFFISPTIKNEEGFFDLIKFS